MYIRSLEFCLNETDLNRLVSGHAPTKGAIANMGAAFEEDHLVLSGHVQVLLAVKFAAFFELSHTSSDIIARLVTIQPMNAFRSKFLSKMVEFIHFATLDAGNQSIRIHIDSLAAHYGVISHLTIEDLTITDNSLTLKLKGGVTL
ncbi:hypothetical protein JW998_02660 [candidate division KSB1 bacterium]|nr:hypothetical protein [candidate division KSB1 bacterium]